ncbi:unnamed protein product [Caenorhabditis brenneri]
MPATMAPSLKSPAWTTSEIRHLISFIARKCAEEQRFCFLTELCKAYKEVKNSNRSVMALKNQAKKHLTTGIDELDEFEMDAKVTMLFRLRIAPTDQFLAKMLDKAEVKVDDFNRITYYSSRKEDGLTLVAPEKPPRKRSAPDELGPEEEEEEEKEQHVEEEDDDGIVYLGAFPSSQRLPHQPVSNSEGRTDSESRSPPPIETIKVEDVDHQELIPQNYYNHPFYMQDLKTDMKSDLMNPFAANHFVPNQMMPHRPGSDWTEFPVGPMYPDRYGPSTSQRDDVYSRNSATTSETNWSTSHRFQDSPRQNMSHGSASSSSTSQEFTNCKKLLKLLQSLVVTMSSPLLQEIEQEISSKDLRGDEKISTEDVGLAFKTTIRMIMKDASPTPDASRSYSLSKMITLLLNIVNYLNSPNLRGVQEDLMKASEDYEDKGYRIPIETVLRSLKTTITLCTP